MTPTSATRAADKYAATVAARISAEERVSKATAARSEAVSLRARYLDDDPQVALADVDRAEAEIPRLDLEIEAANRALDRIRAQEPAVQWACLAETKAYTATDDAGTAFRETLDAAGEQLNGLLERLDRAAREEMSRNGSGVIGGEVGALSTRYKAVFAKANEDLEAAMAMVSHHRAHNDALAAVWGYVRAGGYVDPDDGVAATGTPEAPVLAFRGRRGCHIDADAALAQCLRAAVPAIWRTTQHDRWLSQLSGAIPAKLLSRIRGAS